MWKYILRKYCCSASKIASSDFIHTDLFICQTQLIEAGMEKNVVLTYVFYMCLFLFKQQC